MPIKVNDIVKWWKYYECGTIVSNTGTGLVLEIFLPYSHNALLNTRYLVLKADGEIRYFPKHEIERL
tara:strand:+ start:12927 stop:13127 length:201 start_codon:yes stop_codon:yes gene_type:complete